MQLQAKAGFDDQALVRLLVVVLEFAISIASVAFEDHLLNSSNKFEVVRKVHATCLPLVSLIMTLRALILL